MSWPQRSLALLIALALWNSVALAQEPLGELELRLEGPLEELSVSAGGGPTSVELLLGPGETMRLSIPVRLGPGGVPAPVQLDTLSGTGRPVGEVVVSPIYEELPRRLRMRGLPPLERAVPTPGPARWALLLAAVVLVLAARRTPWRALLVGALGAASLWLPLELPREPSLVLLEADLDSGRWLEVRAAREELELEAGSGQWLRTLPGDATCSLRVERRGSGLARTVSAPGARIFASRELKAGLRLSLDENLLGDLDQVWTRSPDGSWTSHGSWGLGLELPEGARGGSAGLPGWLAAGLPQGVPVLLGRQEGPSGARWVRLVGP